MTGAAPGRGRSAPLAGFWLLLLLTGQLATLQLVRAGPHARYQHFITAEQPFALIPAWPVMVLALQAAAVLAGLAVLRSSFPRLSGAVRSLWAVAAVVLLFVLTSVAPQRDLGAFAFDLAVASGLQLLHLATVVLFASALPAGALEAVRLGADRLLGTAGPDGAAEPGGMDRFAIACGVWVTLAATLLVVLAYQRHPHLPDEVVYVLHARYFAAGQFWLPLPAAPDAFAIDLMTYEPTRWYSPVPPGWPLALAVGASVGLPWLVNPLLGGLSVPLLYVVLREFYPRRTARMAVLLFCASPWQLFLAMSFMTHTWILVCALAATAAVGRLRRDPRARWALLGGAAIGMVSLTRPLEGLIMALLLGFWSLGARGTRWRLAPSAVLTMATATVGALTLPYNRLLTGSARVFPINAYTDRVYGPGLNALGFGPNRGWGWALDPYPGHGLRDVLVNAALNTFSINIELLGWATGSLLVLALFALGGRLRRSDWQMLVAVAAVTTAHHLYWFSGGPDFGARYWYLVIVPCLALTARGLERLAVASGGTGAGERGTAVLAGAAALVVGAMVVFVPWRAADKYYHYRGIRPGIARLAATHPFGRDIVFVRTRRNADFPAAYVYSALEPDAGGPFYAWDRSAAVREAVLQAHGDRRFWFVDAPSVTGAEYEVLAGPLTAAEARRVPDTWSPP